MDFINRDTILAATIQAIAAGLMVHYLFRTEFPGLIAPRTIAAAVSLGVTSVLVDMVYPRVSDFVKAYGV